ncbi:hypothetical protein [Niveibacterium terrae]|uniref:hypothetical protein n=1 Tax=Niveibacterium terrae TaxID=3373598 RepID=UPI003A90E150
MLNAHGEFSVQWFAQVCLVTLRDSFNREGVLAMAAGIRQAWLDAGQPTHWAHVMDLREWQGGTRDGFAASHELLMWNVAHGAKAIIRIHSAMFLARVTERQHVFDDISVPIITVSTPEQAWGWLETHGIACLPPGAVPCS